MIRYHTAPSDTTGSEPEYRISFKQAWSDPWQDEYASSLPRARKRRGELKRRGFLTALAYREAGGEWIGCN